MKSVQVQARVEAATAQLEVERARAEAAEVRAVLDDARQAAQNHQQRCEAAEGEVHRLARACEQAAAMSEQQRVLHEEAAAQAAKAEAEAAIARRAAAELRTAQQLAQQRLAAEAARRAQQEALVEQTNARVVESERRRSELHHCLIEMAAGLKAHRQQVSELTQAQLQQEKQERQLRKDNAVLTYSVKRLHREATQAPLHAAAAMKDAAQHKPAAATDLGAVPEEGGAAHASGLPETASTSKGDAAYLRGSVDDVAEVPPGSQTVQKAGLESQWPHDGQLEVAAVAAADLAARLSPAVKEGETTQPAGALPSIAAATAAPRADYVALLHATGMQPTAPKQRSATSAVPSQQGAGHYARKQQVPIKQSKATVTMAKSVSQPARTQPQRRPLGAAPDPNVAAQTSVFTAHPRVQPRAKKATAAGIKA